MAGASLECPSPWPTESLTVVAAELPGRAAAAAADSEVHPAKSPSQPEWPGTVAPGPPGRTRGQPSLHPGRDAVMVTTYSESAGSQAVRVRGRELESAAHGDGRRLHASYKKFKCLSHSLALSLKLDALCRKLLTFIRQYNLVISKIKMFMIVFIRSKQWLCRLLELLLRNLELPRLRSVIARYSIFSMILSF